MRKIYLRFHCYFLIMFVLAHVGAAAQDINGVWEGNYKNFLNIAMPQKLVVELELYNDSLVTGASHLYYKNNKYEHYRISGVYRKKDSTIRFSEDSVIAVKLGLLVGYCTGDYTMKLTVTDTLLRFNGRWKDNTSKFFGCPSSGVWLQKRIQKDSLAARRVEAESLPGISVKDTARIIRPPVIGNRRSDIQSIIEISKSDIDSIRIDIYDNGTIDQDSVMVYLDDQLLVPPSFISTNAISRVIHIDPAKPFAKIRLVAVSLGSIPPCTALLVVKTRKKRYEVNLSSNFESNGVLEFFVKD